VRAAVPRLFTLFLFSVVLVACNSTIAVVGTNGFFLGFSTSIVITTQDGNAGALIVTISGAPASSSITLVNMPTGVSAQITQPAASSTATINFVASPNAAPGTYSVQVLCTSGGSSTSKDVTIVVAPTTVVSSAIDPSLGINGQLKQLMSTSFQPAEWDYQFFQNHAAIEPAQLNSIGSQHIRIQGISQAVPWKANSNPQLATDWDFTKLDAIVQPVLSVTDHSPEFQIAVAPAFPGLVDSSGHLIVNAANLRLMASYFANLVRYYNMGGFAWGGQTFKSPSSHPITWWGIFNEYNINGLTTAEYVQLYDAVVPAMLAVDPTLKFSALELSDYDYQVGDPRNNLPTFFAARASGGVNAQVDVASTHFYSSCNQKDTDVVLFSTIPGFVSDVQYFRQQLALRPDLANVPVWVTENNVNADYSTGNGMSNCNPGPAFVPDARGTTAFFAAWRPYVFSQLGKAGSQALYHWDYDADTQYSEVDYTTGNKYLSYWVDFTLSQMFPVSSSSSPTILALESSDVSSIESLATKNPDGSYVVMITDRAVHSSSDNNGPGDPRTVIVDVSALGNYSSVTQTNLQNDTDLAKGPQPVILSPAPKLTVTFNGYGTAFLRLIP
jgi:hypothetical protein